VIYLTIILLIYLFQSRLVFKPKKGLHKTPSSVGLAFKQFQAISSEGNRIHGWLVPADSADVTVLYCHGNAGNISDRLETIELFHRLGINVVVFDYQGYGQSEGKPSEEATYEDASAARQFLIDELGVDEKKMIIMGRSLGGPVATRLAALYNPAALILESTFTSAVDLGSDMYPWLPIDWLLKFEYDTQRYLRQVDVPVFMAHSVDDDVVPFKHSQELFEIAKQPKMFVKMVGSHSMGFKDTGSKYSKSLQRFLEKHTPYQKKGIQVNMDG